MRIQLIPRETTDLKTSIQITLLAFATSLALGGAVLSLLDIDPLSAYYVIFESAFFDGYALANTATKATPLVLTGLACALAFRAKLWNVGAEGQLLVGAWAATGVATFWLSPDHSTITMILCMMFAAFLAGALWGGIPGLLRAKYNTNEILTSLMLVYVAVQWNNYWIYAPWSDKGFQMTPAFPDSAKLPTLAALTDNRHEFLVGNPAHLGIILAIVISIVVLFIMFYTRFGFELKLIGANRETAHYSGVPVNRRTVSILMLSGGIAGIAGMFEVSGVVHRLQENFSPGYGFTGILIAWLARLNPVGIVVASLLFGGLLVGGRQIQPSGIPMMLQGIILITLIGFSILFRYRISFTLHSGVEDN